MKSKKRTIKRRFLSVLTIILLFSAGLSAQTLDTNVPEGWAIYSGSNMTTTTGGGDGTVVTVKTLSDLSKYCGDSKPYVIFVEGTISGTDPVTVKSDKTIIGKAGSKLSGVGLSMSGASNVIIRNMNISGSADGIAARNTHHLWVDHCELWDNGDGLLDITSQSTYCTVSWCKFYYVNQTEHRLACLIGSGGGDHPEDFGYLRVTYHHNWYGNKVDQRQPRIMYGLGHVYNGYYTCSRNAYGIGVGSYGAALIENNYFKDMANPHYLMYNIYCWITARGNKYDNTTGSKANGKLGERDVVKAGSPEYTCDVKEFSEAPYLYTLDDVTKVPSLLTSGCAPKADFANIGMVPVPGQGAIEVSTTPKLQWVKGTSGRDATSYIVYLGTTTNPAKVATVTGQSYSPSKLQSGTVYYWRVDAVTPSSTVEGKLWRFKTVGAAPSNVAPTVSLTSPEDNTTYSDGQVDLTLSATASDSDGSIWKVDFYNGTELLNTATHSPYGYVWKNVPEGTYTLTAVATDNEGLSTTSAAVTVVVRKPTTRIYQSEETDFWTTAQKWTPSVVPVASDTTIIRKGEVKSTGIDQTAPLSVEPEGVFRLVGDCTVDNMVLLGGVVRSHTSNPLFILTSNITLEENSTIWAGSVTTSVFRIDGTISGSKNLEKTNVGVLNLNVDASDFSGVWTVSGGTLLASKSDALGTGGVNVNATDTLKIAAANQTAFLNMEETSNLTLDADLTVEKATLGTTKLAAGTYTSADYPNFISGGGKLIVTEGEATGVDLIGSGDFRVTVVPNPVLDEATVVFNSIGSKDCELQLLDTKGELLFLHTLTLNDGENKVSIPVENLSSGLYLIKAMMTDNVLVLKMIKK